MTSVRLGFGLEQLRDLGKAAEHLLPSFDYDISAFVFAGIDEARLAADPEKTMKP